MAASCQANTSTIGSLIVLLLGMDRFMRVPLSCWLSRCMGRNWNIPVENFIAFGCREERRRRESISDYFVSKKSADQQAFQSAFNLCLSRMVQRQTVADSRAKAMGHRQALVRLSLSGRTIIWLG